MSGDLKWNGRRPLKMGPNSDRGDIMCDQIEIDGSAVKMATVISLHRSFNSIITVDEEWISCLICCIWAAANIHVWTTVLLQI